MWSKNYSKCVECGGIDRPHFGKGKCRRCYLRQYNQDNAAQVAASRRQWYEDNMQGTERQRMKREQDHFSGNRQEVLKRDNHQCKHCGSPDKLVVHHDDGNGRGKPEPNNSIDNLLTLCRSCHMNVHRQLLMSARKSTRYSPNSQATVRT